MAVASETGVGSSRSASDRLVSAAERIIDRGEIGPATVGDIADAAGLHRVTFYRHFPDKEALIAEVLERRATPVIEHAARAMETGGYFPDLLIESMVSAIVEARSRPGLIAALGVYPADDGPHSAGTSMRFRQRAVDATAPHVALAQKAGLLRNDVSGEEIVQWLLEVCLSLLLFRPGDSENDVRRHMFRFVLPALGASSSHGERGRS